MLHLYVFPFRALQDGAGSHCSRTQGSPPSVHPGVLSLGLSAPRFRLRCFVRSRSPSAPGPVRRVSPILVRSVSDPFSTAGYGVGLISNFVTPYIQNAEYGNLGAKISWMWAGFSLVS